MSEELLKKIQELEKVNKVMRLASQQWEHLQKVYKESNDRLQQLERELSASNERTDRALFGGDLAWWDWNYSTGKVHFNENRARMLGYNMDELPKTFGDITRMIHPDDYELTMARLNAHLSGDHPNYEAEFRLKTKSGDWKWFFDKGKIVETDIFGKPLRLAGVLIDIDVRKNTENELIVSRDNALADSRAKSHFLASMSHEIYTPMAGVIGMADILKQSKLSQEQEEYLNVIVKSATNLMSILNDIIEYSKIESGKLEFHEKPFSVHQVVEEITASFVDKANEKGIEILSFQDPNIPVEVVGDPMRLRQVLKIFTDNALKFTEKGEIRIEAEFVAWDEETVKVRFNVIDTGIGITEAGIKKLFTSFSKLDAPDAMKYGGGGLGLAIARRIIDRMNGQVHVESVPGSGTTFSFTVHFERYKDTEVADPMKEMLHGVKVLVIDPQKSRRTILRNYFERWDAEVDECGNLTDAVKMIRHQAHIKRAFDMVVVEFHLQGTDGLKFAISMNKDPLMQRSKLLLTTSRMFPVSSAELAAAGILVALVRPYTLSRLKSRIKEVLTQVKKEFSGLQDEVELHLKDDQKKVLNILLAEDNLINQKVALVTLEKMGHATDLAENGNIAVEMFAKKEYDLVLMDMFMPEMDGLEATHKIRELEALHPGRNPVHICAITANTSSEDEEQCYRAGMNSYISKPFKLGELIKILNRL
jgi:two-component system sensor histidine kinase/response regulator